MSLALFSQTHLDAALQGAGAEVLVATTISNFRFLTNIASRKLALLPGFRVAAIYDGGHVTAVIPVGMLADAAASRASVDRYVVYGSWPNFAAGAASRDPLETQTRALFDRTFPTWHADFDTALRNAVPSTANAVADSMDLGLRHEPRVFARARRIKNPVFVAALRESLRHLEDSVAAMTATIAEGETMLDLTRTAAAEFASRDAWSWVGSIQIGPAGSLAVAADASIVAQQGDLVRWDLAASFSGIWADSARTLSLGTPSDTARRAFDAIAVGHRAALAAAKPGLPASELYRITAEATRRAGLADYDAPHTGHAIGLDLYDTPLIAPGHDAVLEPGMVLCLENPWFTAGLGTVAEEDMVLVTETGIEILNTTPTGLVQL